MARVPNRWISLMCAALLCALVAVSFASDYEEEYQATQGSDQGEPKVREVGMGAGVVVEEGPAANYNPGPESGSLSVTVTTEGGPTGPYIAGEGDVK